MANVSTAALKRSIVSLKRKLRAEQKRRNLILVQNELIAAVGLAQARTAEAIQESPADTSRRMPQSQFTPRAKGSSLG